MFDFKVPEETRISGYMKLKLWVKCRGYDIMDLFVWIKKLGQDGEIVPVEVEIWPHSRIWHSGETLRVEVEGKYFKAEWLEDHKMDFEEDNGDGIHVIHTGGKYDSYLQIPFIPPKYKSDAYELR